MKKTLSLILVLLACLLPLTLTSCSKKDKTDNIDISMVKFEDAEFEYNGNPQVIRATNLPNGVSVRYEGNGKIAPGEYIVKANFYYKDKIIGSKTAKLTITGEISTDDPDLEAIKDIKLESKTIEYDGKAHSLALSKELPEGFVATWVNNEHTYKGEYEVICIISKLDKKVTELKATLTITGGPEDPDKVELAEGEYAIKVGGKTIKLDANTGAAPGVVEFMNLEVEVTAGDVLEVYGHDGKVDIAAKPNEANNIDANFVVKETGTVKVYVTLEHTNTNEIGVWVTKPEKEPNMITLYFKPNDNWKSQNARFALYCTDSQTWYDLADADGDGIYEIEIDSNKVQTVIFCRMNPAAKENDWKNKWNQTLDLDGFDATHNFYELPAGAWDKPDHKTWTEKK